MKVFLIALPLCVLGFSCERHDFEETKKLHEKHGHGAGHDSHGADHGAGHGDDHGKKEGGQAH